MRHTLPVVWGWGGWVGEMRTQEESEDIRLTFSIFLTVCDKSARSTNDYHETFQIVIFYKILKLEV